MPEEAKKPEMTREQFAEQVRKAQDNVFQAQDTMRRRAKLQRAGGYHFNGDFIPVNPSTEFTYAELREIVPEPEDRRKYIKLALTKNGFLAAPKTPGRKKKHFTKGMMELKSRSLAIFQRLFTSKAERLEAVCKEEKLVYQGVPESVLPELGEQAKKLAVRDARQARKARKRARRRQQEFHRKVNAGLLQGSSGEKNYMWKGGQYQ